jgi:hypothetical protein
MFGGAYHAYTQKPVERPPGWVPPPQPDAPELSYDKQTQPNDVAEDLDKKLQIAPSEQPHHTSQAQEQAPSSQIDTDPLGEWTLKEIAWPDPRLGGFRRTVKVLTQNANGPCSLLALANVLILRGSFHISHKLEKITYAALSALIADFLVSRPQSGNPRGLTLEAALNILPTTVRGLNVNVGFDDIKSFQATEGSSDELALFEMAGVDLVHGWIADTGSSEEWAAMKRAAGDEIPTYDGLQEAIIRGMGTTEGQAATDGKFPWDQCR